MAIKLSNLDYADFELLKVINDNSQKRTKQLAELMDAEVRALASRLSWMKRMSLIERTIALGWVLAPAGKNLLDGWSGDLMTVRELSLRAQRSPARRWATRREFNRNIGVRR